MGYQHCVFVGNAGRDAELSYTPQGIAVCKFSIAVSKVTGKGDQRKEKTVWIKCTVWRERAETAGQYIRKGSKLLVAGEIDVSSYLDKQGQPAATLELTVNDFQFLDPKPSGESTAEPQFADSGEQENSHPF